MPAALTTYPYLSWKYNRIVLRLPIPKPVQPIFGKPMFRVIMAQSDMPSAHAASLPILAEWRQQIDAAKTASQDARQAEVMRLRTAFESFDGKPLGQTGGELFGRIMDFLFQTYGGVSATQQRLVLAEAKGNVAVALPAPARQPLALITGMTQPTTPFLTHLADWKAKTHLRGKYLDQAVTAIQEFAKDVPCCLETLSGGMVQAWIDNQLRPADDGKPLLPETVRHKLKGCRAYWVWMQTNDKADKERHPFTGRSIRDHRTARERMDAQPRAFAVVDVPRLWQQAEGDCDLFSVIQIGAYTAMRREEVCALKVSQIRINAETGIRFLFEVGDKSIAALRNVPIPRTIAPLIDELASNATKDGYLIHDGYKDKNGHRGGDVGKRFSDMKTAMGFSPQHQFRSLRKTAIRCMKEQRKVVGLEYYESIVKNIAGHKDRDITSGLYAGEFGLADKLLVIETINYPS